MPRVRPTPGSTCRTAPSARSCCPRPECSWRSGQCTQRTGWASGRNPGTAGRGSPALPGSRRPCSAGYHLQAGGARVFLFRVAVQEKSRNEMEWIVNHKRIIIVTDGKFATSESGCDNKVVGLVGRYWSAVGWEVLLCRLLGPAFDDLLDNWFMQAQNCAIELRCYLTAS